MHNQESIPLQKKVFHFQQHLDMESEVHNIRSTLDSRDEASSRLVTTTSATASGTDNSSIDHGTGMHSWLDNRDEASGRLVTNTPTIASGIENSSTDHWMHLPFEDTFKFTCGTCKKVFSSNSQLDKHASVHNKTRTFPCDDCSVSFHTEGHLRKHRRSKGHKIHSQKSMVTEDVDDQVAQVLAKVL